MNEQCRKNLELLLSHPVIVSNDIQRHTRLLVLLAADGKAQEVLDILIASPCRLLMEPMEVALRIYLGEEVYTNEIFREVASDIVKQIEAAKRLPGGNSDD